VGETSRGTPVQINRRVHEAGRVIVTGRTVFHYFGGYGGGRKGMIPGIASLETIAYNHARNLHPTEDRRDPAVRIGGLEGNPVAEDMLEGARLCNPDLLINTVLNRHGDIARIFAGDLEAAHRAACQFAHDLYAVYIDEPADLVIASAGHAKNFIQSHKALFNAWQALKPNGRIILAAPAPEGLGNERFRYWLGLGTRHVIFSELREHAEINGQTALSIVEKAPQSILLSELNETDGGLLGMQRANTLEEALQRARNDLKEQSVGEPSCYLMPAAAYTVPFIGREPGSEAPAPAEAAARE